ncbi:MAG TPA: putative lipid II flippase FtsW [Acidimicrobiales bacterium]|nr:putative lipid II flippase FtsW [Acidimicrobiales bacterium]
MTRVATGSTGGTGVGRSGVALSPPPRRARTAALTRTAPAHATPTARRSGLVLLLALVGVLNLVGLVMVLSSSSVDSIRQYGSPWHFFVREVLWLAAGGAVFAVALTVDYHRWRRLAPAAMVGTVVALLAVLVPGVGVKVSGASRWLGTSSLQIQPSEFAKLALIFFAADVLERRSDRGRWRYRYGPVVLMLVVLVILVMKQPDMGTSMVLAFIAVVMLFTAGSPLRALAGLLGVATLAGVALAVMAPYRMARILSFLHPARDASNSGYQAVQAATAMGSGGLLGAGLGSSIASWGYLPNQQTDFIFAVIGEETGLVGSLIVVGLFVGLALVGVRIACRAPDRFGVLVAGGVTAWLVGQALINIGAVVGLLPVTGVPLPFVSYGGSSLVFSLFAAGALANVARSA